MGAQASADPVPMHAVADSPAHDKADPGGFRAVACPLVQYHDTAATPRTSTNDRREFRRATHPVRSRQHRASAPGRGPVRPTARGVLCAAERRRWRGRREYASAAGNHESWHGGGCSAERCAYSRSVLHRLGRSRNSLSGWPPGAACRPDSAEGRQSSSTSRASSTRVYPASGADRCPRYGSGLAPVKLHARQCRTA